MNDFAFVFAQSFFVASEPNQENPETDVFALVNAQPEKEGAAWYWKNGGGRNSNDYFWLITLDSKLPFEYIFKKEFAERLKVYYQEKIKKAERDYIKNTKVAEETYQRIKSMNAAEANNFKEQSTVQYKKQLEFEKSQYSKNMAVVEKILQTSDSKLLGQPAIIDQLKGYNEFQGFVDADHQYANWVIKPNPAYFNPKLPKSSPQFMVLYCDKRDEPIFKTAREELLKAIDFASPQSMLGK